jgi:hypothetical protein
VSPRLRLPVVYPVWAGVVAGLYSVCRWMAGSSGAIPPVAELSLRRQRRFCSSARRPVSPVRHGLVGHVLVLVRIGLGPGPEGGLPPPTFAGLRYSRACRAWRPRP